MSQYEIQTSNYNYDATAFLKRVRDLLARDKYLLGRATQRSALLRSTSTGIQNVITRIDVLPKSDAGSSAEYLDYGKMIFVNETLDQETLLSRLNRLTEKSFQIGEETLHSATTGFSDRYEPSQSTYSAWPATIFDISFGNVQLSYEPLLHATLKSFTSSVDAIRELLRLSDFNGLSDGRLGHIQLCIPNLNARIEHLELNANRLNVRIAGSAAPESLKLSVNCKKENESITMEKRLDQRELSLDLPFRPSELHLWLISSEGFLADFHDENQHHSAGANAVLPKQNQISFNNVYSLSSNDLLEEAVATTAPAQVFIVHGHNTSAKESVARFVEKLGLQPIILHEQPNRGNTIIEKFELHAGVSFAIVLVTGDDEAREIGSSKELRKRARQNVVFEFGFFVGKLGRMHVCALLDDGIDVPSDYQGVVYIPLDSAGNWKFLLVRELKAAGLDVDANRAV